MKTTHEFIEDMVTGYLEAALWSTIGFDDEHLDAKYSISDIPESFKKKANDDCLTFLMKATPLLEPEEFRADMIGHNFWLNRHRHGAGFWDGDYVHGDALSELCHEFKECDDDLRDCLLEGNE